jgi:hypothetical protein
MMFPRVRDVKIQGIVPLDQRVLYVENTGRRAKEE